MALTFLKISMFEYIHFLLGRSHSASMHSFRKFETPRVLNYIAKDYTELIDFDSIEITDHPYYLLAL